MGIVVALITFQVRSSSVLEEVVRTQTTARGCLKQHE
jgi:hypothetical protein